MTWVRIDDAAPMHPKLLEVGPEASWLWVAGIAHCNRGLTNGLIKKVFLAALYPSGHWPLAKLRALAQRLVEVRLWHDEGDHYRVHQYEIQQEEALKENVESRRAADRERKRVSRQARMSRTSAGHVTDNPANVTDTKADFPHASDYPDPVPSRPVLDPSLRSGSPPSPPSRESGSTPAGIVESALVAALGAVGARLALRTGDARHLADAAAAMKLADSRPLRDVAAEWCPDFVAEYRSRTPVNLAAYAQSRAANGGKKLAMARGKGGGFSPPAEASQFTATEITPELFAKEAL